MFGFGSNSDNELGINKEKVAKPVKLDRFGDVDFVDANHKTCTIDQNGQMFLNGAKETRIATGAKQATSRYQSHFVLDAAGDLWSWGKNDAGQLGHGDTSE